MKIRQKIAIIRELIISQTDSIIGYPKISSISTDENLTENSDSIISTQKAIKSYIDSNSGGGNDTIDSSSIVYITLNESPYTIQNNDKLLLIDCSTNTIIINFPDATLFTGRKIITKKIDESNNSINYTPYISQTIEGENNSYDSIMPGEFMTFISNGISWLRIG